MGCNRSRLHHQRLGKLDSSFTCFTFTLHWMVVAGAEEGKPIGKGVEGQGGDAEGGLGGDLG